MPTGRTGRDSVVGLASAAAVREPGAGRAVAGAAGGSTSPRSVAPPTTRVPMVAMRIIRRMAPPWVMRRHCGWGLEARSERAGAFLAARSRVVRLRCNHSVTGQVTLRRRRLTGGKMEFRILGPLEIAGGVQSVRI